MTFSRFYHFTIRWVLNLISWQAAGALLSSFGVLWLSAEISTFFFANSSWPNTLRDNWVWFGVAGLILAILMRKPKLIVSHKLNGRDVTLNIAIGDMYKMQGALIIGSNTTFDTRLSRELIDSSSVQGVFTKKYYNDDSQLDREIKSALKREQFTELGGNRVGKSKRYDIGTCARLNPKDRTAYFVAIANINEHGTATSSFDNLKEALSRLWVFIETRGTKEPLVMPVLGTGFSRLSQTREEIVHEIIRSFIAACSERTIADSLTIVITPIDVAVHRISLDDLGSFLCHECRYVSYSNIRQLPVGTPA